MSSFLQSGHFITSHGSLEGIDRINLSHNDTSTVRPQRLCALSLWSERIQKSQKKSTYSFSNVAIASDDSNLAGKHDVGSTLDTVDE